jgi:hypothetical protein
MDGTIAAAPPMSNARSSHFSVTLQDGRVLVGGGITTGGSTTSTAEIFNPVANSWSSAGLGMMEARAGATAALLQDGRVVIAGGHNGSVISSTIEIFDPVAGTFSAAGTLSSPRSQHAMTVLLDGRVLIVGGNNGTAPVASTDVFDPVAGTVSAGPVLNTARYGHSATTLLNGIVAVIGGNNGNANSAQMDVTPAETVDFTAATPAFAQLAVNLATPREGHLAILLPNNNSILIVGGTSAGATVTSTELFTPQDSSAGAWTYGFGPTGGMTTARSIAASSTNQVNAPTSKMQRNGIVMIAGGSDASGNALGSTEAYGYPTVQTDQSDYPPGTTVTISGSGFQAGETVTIQLVESPLVDAHGPYTVVADSNGNFVNTSFTTDEHDVDVRFYLSSTGGTSGLYAQNVFTDNKNVTVAFAGTGSGSVTSNPTGIACTDTSGTASGTCAVSVGNLAQVTLTATPTSPSTIGAWNVPSGYTINSGCATGSTTCTFTLNNTNQTVTVAFNPGPATKLGFVQQPSNTPAGSSITPPVTVQVEDAGGNPVGTSAASIGLAIGSNPGGGTLTGGGAVNAVSGVATFSGLSINKTGTGYTLTASSSGLTGATSGSFNVTAGAATQLVFGTGPSNTAAGSAITSAVTVQIEDADNNLVTANTSTVTIAISSGGAFSGSSTTSMAAVNGVATFSNLVPTAAGTGFTLKATDGALTAAISNSFNVTATAANKLAFVQQPTTTTAGNAISPAVTVQIQDQFGNPTSSTATVTISGGGTMAGASTTSVAAANGLATFSNLIPTQAGSFSLSAASTGLTGAISNSFTVNAAVANKLAFVQQPTTTRAGSAISPAVTVQIQDQFSNLTSSTATVTISGGGTLAGTSTTSVAAVSGLATFSNLVPTQVGSFTLTAASSGLASATSDSFTVTAPDLTAVKTDTVSGSTSLGNNWTWTIEVSNVGNGAANFTANNQVILTDSLPNANITYGSPATGNFVGITNSNQIGCTITASTLTCVQMGNGQLVSIAAGGSFTVQFTATPTTAGTFVNPTSGGTCEVDPNNNVGEINLANNFCSDTVTTSAANTSTTITSPANNASGTTGQPVTVNFTVANISGNAVAPTGTVTVSDGTGDSCAGVLTAGLGGTSTGTCSLTPKTTGTKTLVASFPASTNFNASNSSSTTFTANARTTSTALSFGTNPDVIGQPTSVTVTVTDTAGAGASNPAAL